LAVRQECGFGCVVCGEAICQYEHVDPEFCDATEHLVPNIALLCGTCHEKVTTGFLTKHRVKKARVTPLARQQGFARTYLEGPDPLEEFTVLLGGCRFIRPRSVLRIFGEDLLTIRQPEAANAPLLVSGRFFNDQNDVILSLSRAFGSPTWDER
jgi:hypothetical protein